MQRPLLIIGRWPEPGYDISIHGEELEKLKKPTETF